MIAMIEIDIVCDGEVIRRCSWPASVPFPTYNSQIFIADEEGDDRSWIVEHVTPLIEWNPPEHATSGINARTKFYMRVRKPTADERKNLRV